jgi:hypothetical protein
MSAALKTGNANRPNGNEEGKGGKPPVDGARWTSKPNEACQREEENQERS